MQPTHEPRRQLLIFFCSTIVTAAVLVITGWFSGIREFFHGAILTLAIAAFFPFVLIIAGITLPVICLMVAIFASIIGGGGTPPDPIDGASLVEAGVWLIPRYYAFWARRQHPAFWGIPFGALVGCLVLNGLIIGWILPGEAATVRTLEETQQRIETYYKQKKHYPDPDARGYLAESALGNGQAMPDDSVRDGFRRPLLYRVSGRGRLASYTLKSLGFDGEPGRDDFCISGETSLMGWAEIAGFLARNVKVKRGAAVVNKLKAIRSLRCDP